MKQQAALFAWQGLEKYDGVRPLENFLRVHVHNRLFNFKRNNYARPDKPCDNCPLNAYVNGECTAFDNMLDCELYERWYNRNEVKKSLMSTKEHIEYSSDIYQDIEEELLKKEIFKLVDSKIPVTLREDWIRFINKSKLSKIKREALLTTIYQIIQDEGVNLDD